MPTVTRRFLVGALAALGLCALELAVVTFARRAEITGIWELERGALFLGTWPNGAVIISSGPDGLVVETYRSKQRLVVK